MLEEKEGYMPVYQDKFKIFRSQWRDYYVLFVTTNRIIATRTFKRVKRGRYEHARVYLSQDSIESRANFEKIRELSPEELLKTDEDNFAIPKETIDRIVFKKTRGHDNEMQIHTTSDKYKFSFNPEFHLPDVSEEYKKEQLDDKFENYIKFIEAHFPGIVENEL